MGGGAGAGACENGGVRDLKLRTKRVRLAVAVSACLAVSAAVLVLWTIPYFTDAPPQSDEEPHQTPLSPDGRWRALVYCISYGGAAGRTLGLATVQPAAGGPARTVYYGEPATVKWRGDQLVFTEERSGRQHVVDPSRGVFDSRYDDPLNLYGTPVMMAVPILIVLAFGVVFVRSSTSQSRRAS